MKIIFLSSKDYEECEKNCGDCIIIDTGTKVILYDCGCNEHAEEVIRYLKENDYDKVYIILSHNDSDHFSGLNYLIEKGKVHSITTVLLLKHIDDILDELDDGRRTREGIKKQIADYFDNIYSLSGNNLNDSLDESLTLDSCVNIVGPNYDYLIEAVAKALDNSESDNIDMETIVNAISVQVEVIMSNHKVLLTGDASFESIKDKIREYDAIQLPHHGKYNQATKIFEENDGREDVIYMVSDNTGNSSGGSDELMKNNIGKKIKNKKSGNVTIDANSFDNQKIGCYGKWDTLYWTNQLQIKR